MTRAKHSPLYVVKELLETRYSGASVAFLAGSVMRGEASTYSDIDLVIVYPKIANAFRESFYHRDWPVEAFVHDPETLLYFFEEIDRREGSSTLAEMVFEGLEVPEATPFSQEMKAMAENILKKGPPELSPERIQDWRYQISELVDDIREPRNRPELIAAATRMYYELADFYFRTRGQYSAQGKAILKRLKKADPLFLRRFVDAFDLLFTAGQPEKVIELSEELLAPAGGILFDEYRREVPAHWRKSK